MGEDSQCDTARGATCALVQPPLCVCLYGAGPAPTPKPTPPPTPKPTPAPKPTPEPTPDPSPTPAPTPGHEGECLFADTQAECEQTTKQGDFCKWCPDFDMCFDPDEECDSKLKLKFREVSVV